jgi:hypothetical protein
VTGLQDALLLLLLLLLLSGAFEGTEENGGDDELFWRPDWMMGVLKVLRDKAGLVVSEEFPSW